MFCSQDGDINRLSCSQIPFKRSRSRWSFRSPRKCRKSNSRWIRRRVKNSVTESKRSMPIESFFLSFRRWSGRKDLTILPCPPKGRLLGTRKYYTNIYANASGRAMPLTTISRQMLACLGNRDGIRQSLNSLFNLPVASKSLRARARACRTLGLPDSVVGCAIRLDAVQR